MELYCFAVENKKGNFVYLMQADNLFVATAEILKLAEKKDIIEVSRNEAEELVNVNGYKIFIMKV